jgi:hypothetical protein
VRRFLQDAKICRREYWLHEKIALHLGADQEGGGIMAKKGYTPEQIINKLREAEIYN